MKLLQPIILKLLFSVILFCCVNTITAQTVIDSSAEDITAPAVEEEDSVTVYKDSVIENKQGNFTLIDTSRINGLNVAKVNLKDTISSLKKQEDYWYADGVEKEKPKEVREKRNGFFYWLDRAFSSNAFRIFSWVLIIGIVIVLIVLFLRSNGIGLFAANAKHIKTDDTETNISDNIFEIDFEAMIAKYIGAGNYKLATRLLFLRLLKIMTEKNILEYAPDKTNFDYLFALAGTASFNDFANAVKNYEYVWYGNFSVNENQFNLIKTNFDKLQQQLVG